MAEGPAVETKTLAPRAPSVGVARAFAAAAAYRWGIDAKASASVILVVSELVTNAILHAEGATAVELKLVLGSGQVRVEVADGRGDRRPRFARPGPLDTSGRGLALVASLSLRWGVDVRGPDEKVVWAEVVCNG